MELDHIHAVALMAIQEIIVKQVSTCCLWNNIQLKICNLSVKQPERCSPTRHTYKQSKCYFSLLVFNPYQSIKTVTASCFYLI